MSFSSRIKQELNKNNTLSDKTKIKYELIGYFLSGNTSVVSKQEIKFSTESDYNINRFSKLLTNLDIDHKIEVVGKIFTIRVKIKALNLEEMKIENENIYIAPIQELKPDNMRNIIKGIFLGAGSINNPNKEYHLEMDVSNKVNLIFVLELLDILDIKVKHMKNKNDYAIYIKDGEEISKFLALIEANKAVMEFEDIRIQKEMRGKVNRLVNCKTANLNKTINASIEQIEAIQKLKKEKRFNKLDDNLKEIANLRLEFPDMSLIELGKQLERPLGKSGVNYRLKKIVDLANE